ncbi:SEC-C metal-binding domain-containing protein [Bacillus suaedae]|uniref:SEC-C domain-containing protein n=1 Tax=Halalkalibacter suaedae TaxID=2822140 RepID=A0A940WXQ7_9BACI|nr:SEC-C metal-binding domain-containing protein [Bacillus suaedae]MBP3950211.1 SEC-C domain-containing protein [Bacillus suaedae]
MTTFLQRIEAALLSEDRFVQSYAVQMLEQSFLAKPETLFTALEAVDRSENGSSPTPSILPFIDFIPVDEAGIQELISRIQKKDQNLARYLHLLERAPTDLLLQYQQKLTPFTPRTFFENLQLIKDLSVDELFEEFGTIMNQLETTDSLDLFQFGQRMVQEFIDRDEIQQWEVEAGIRGGYEEDDYLTYDAIYSIVMAGLLRVESVIPDLVNVLSRDENDAALEESMKALIQIGTEEVVEAVEPIALKGESYLYTIEVLAKIKTKSAEEALFRLYDRTTNLTQKTLVADALCQHLSVEAIPIVEQLIETGYDSTMLELEESIYANCILNGIDHPKLAEWRATLEAASETYEEAKQHIGSLIQMAEKVGRNDPCPCESGKKYKKCCGA